MNLNLSCSRYTTFWCVNESQNQNHVREERRRIFYCAHPGYHEPLKGELHRVHPWPKINMFCGLSQNRQHLKMIYASYSKLSKELKNSIEI